MLDKYENVFGSTSFKQFCTFYFFIFEIKDSSSSLILLNYLQDIEYSVCV